MMMFLIKRSKCDDDDAVLSKSEYDDVFVSDRKAKVLKKMLLIERSKC